MKSKKIFILLSALALSLVGCTSTNNGGGNGGNASSGQAQGIAVSSVAINKESLTLEPGDSETLRATVEPDNASDVSVTWASSNDAVATVDQNGIVTAVAEGNAVISATSVSTPSVKGECQLTVKILTAKDLYGASHAGTEADPLTNEDAILVAKHKDVGQTATAKKFYIRGEVDYFQEVPNSNGNVTFTFKPATNDGERFIAYRLKKGADGAAVSFDDVWKGGVATIYASIYNYKDNTPETKEGYIVGCSGTKVAPQTVSGKTVAQAIETVVALHDNETSFDLYEVTGYITNVVAIGTFFMADEKGEVAAPGMDDFEVYQYAGDNAKLCTINAKVKVTCSLKKYVSTSKANTYQYETGSVSNVEILEMGDEPAITVQGPTALAEVAKDTEYFAGATQATINKNLFLKGTASSGGYLESTDFANAKKVVLKEATGGFNIQFKDGKYVGMNSNKKVELKDNAADAKVFVWDAANKSLSTTEGTDTYYLTVYGTFDTFGFSTVAQCMTDGKVKNGNFLLSFFAIEQPAAVTEFQVDFKAEVKMGKTQKIGVRTNPYNADLSAGITWTSSVETVATVADGVATPHKMGKTVITGKLGTFTDECNLTVLPSIDKEKIDAGSTGTITVADSGKASDVATFASSDATIASVTAEGVVNGVAPGKATITVTSADLVAEIEVTIEKVEVVDVKWTSAEIFGYNGSADVGYNTVTEVTLDGITLGLTDMAAYKNQGGDIQFKKTSGKLEFKSATSKKITKVILQLSGTKAFTCKLYAASDVAGLASASAATGTDQVYTFDASANIHAIKIGGGTGASYLKSISLVYSD